MHPPRIVGTHGWGIGVAMVGAITVLAALVTVARMAHAAAPGDPVPPGAERFVIDPSVSTAAYRVGETALLQNQFHAATGVTTRSRDTWTWTSPTHRRPGLGWSPSI